MSDLSKENNGYGTSWIQALIGQTLDARYQIDDFVGQGAMGVVFKARQLRLRRPVAIKIPRPELANNPEFLARFEREALTMAKMVHENIVQVIDVFVSQDPSVPSFIVMEFVQGEALDTFLQAQRHSLTLSAVLDLFAQIARAIDSAHAHGVVHRDIKPENIVVTMPQRVPKIMDFGIARVDMEDVFRTTESAAIGTPAFMSPEQVAGADVTGASDIYAFAMTIYNLLARELPFDANTATALLFAHTHTDPIPIHERNPVLPERLSLVLGQALSKKPAMRPASAQELVQGVQQSLIHLQKRPFSDLLLEESATVVVSPRPPQLGEKSPPPVEEVPPTPPPREPSQAVKRERSWKKVGCLAAAGGLVLLCLLLHFFHRSAQERLAEAVPVEERLEQVKDWGIFLDLHRPTLPKVKEMDLDLVFLRPRVDNAAKGEIPRHIITDIRATGTLAVAYIEHPDIHHIEGFSFLEGLLKQGFDGVCVGNLDLESGRKEVLDWMANLVKAARDTDPDFLLFQHGTPKLVFSPKTSELDELGRKYLESLDGIVLDSELFEGLTPLPSEQLKSLERLLNTYKVSPNHPKKVLLREFIWDNERPEDKANRERSEWFRAWSKERGFVPCVMPIEKQPDLLTPKKKTPVPKPPAGDGALEGIHRWINGGLAKDVPIEEWEKAACGLLVLDPFHSSAYEGPYKRKDIQRIQASGKKVFATLPLTFADMTSWYGEAFGKASETDMPSWLGPANALNPRCHWVRYWDPAWQRVLLGNQKGTHPSSLDRILGEGFDGIMLLGLEGVDFWSEERQEIGNAEARRKLVDLVETVQKRLEERQEGSSCLVIGPLRRAVLESPGGLDTTGTDYLASLDAFWVAGLFFQEGELLPEEERKERLRKLQAVRDIAGKDKPVLIQEFLVDTGLGKRGENMQRFQEYMRLSERYDLIFCVVDSRGELKRPLLGKEGVFDRKTLPRWRDGFPRQRALKNRKP